MHFYWECRRKHTASFIICSLVMILISSHLGVADMVIPPHSSSNFTTSTNVSDSSVMLYYFNISASDNVDVLFYNNGTKNQITIFYI